MGGLLVLEVSWYMGNDSLDQSFGSGRYRCPSGDHTNFTYWLRVMKLPNAMLLLGI